MSDITIAHELVHVELMDFRRKSLEGQDGQQEFEKVRQAKRIRRNRASHRGRRHGEMFASGPGETR